MPLLERMHYIKNLRCLKLKYFDFFIKHRHFLSFSVPLRSEGNQQIQKLTPQEAPNGKIPKILNNEVPWISKQKGALQWWTMSVITIAWMTLIAFGKRRQKRADSKKEQEVFEQHAEKNRQYEEQLKIQRKKMAEMKT